jgi:hypothetical protein
MPRSDLLALSLDDLAALSTRGKVNEALRDLEKGVTGQLTETDEGAIRVEWSDNRISELPARAGLKGGRCSCHPIDPCKHLVRLVLLYQRQHQEHATAEPPAPAQPWDPGSLPDAELARHFRPAALARIRKQFDAGILAELVRGTRPVARFHVPVATVRFLVPGDLAYTRCDCARQPPCEHAVLAVWAFRELAAELRAGMVSAGSAAPAAPVDLLDAVDALLAEFLLQGIAGASALWPNRLARLAQRCQQADLIWPGELLEELIQQQEAYSNHDARFDPTEVADRLGELVLRLDAIRAGITEVPQLLIRGSSGDRPIELGKSVFWGLGCGIHVHRRSVDLIAYLYDTRSAQVLALCKQILDDSDEDRERSFGTLSRFVAIKGTPFAQVGIGILQLDGGRRSATYELQPGRSAATVLVQDRFNWEEIQPPVLVEEYAELEARLSNLPPSAFRPRRLAEDFHVLRVVEVDNVRFDAASQQILARLKDHKGQHCLLEHPYTTRGRVGAEALLAQLHSRQGKIVFVSGSIQRTQRGLIVRPVGVVIEEQGARRCLQPWIERETDGGRQETPAVLAHSASDPVRECLWQLQLALGELCLNGLARSDPHTARAWRERVQQAESVGFSRLAQQIAELTASLENKAHTLRWNHEPAVRAALRLVALLRLSRDLAG